MNDTPPLLAMGGCRRRRQGWLPGRRRPLELDPSGGYPDTSSSRIRRAVPRARLSPAVRE